MSVSGESSLTPRMSECLEFIKAYTLKHGVPPNVREIAGALERKSKYTNGVHETLKRLAARGLLVHEKGRARGYSIPVPEGCCRSCFRPLDKEPC